MIKTYLRPLEKAYQFCLVNSRKIVIGASILALVYHLILLARLILISDISIGTDTARDFLLMDEVAQKGYTLIGPRSSAIGGLFHGPLWIYVSYPVYFLSHASPIVESYLWMVWYIAFILMSYFFINRLLRDKYIALVSAALVATISFEHTSKMINPFGAMTFMPLFLFTLYRSYELKSWRWAIAHILVNGIMIQFQMAVGAPLLFTTLAIWLYRAWKDKYIYRFFSLPVLVIPLSTFILFELRHDFSQTRSTLSQLLGHDVYRVKMPFYDVFINRLFGALEFGWQLLLGQYGSLNILALILFVIAITTLFSKGKRSHIEQVFLFLSSIYGLFWFFSLMHNGNVLSYYYYPILIVPIVIIVISSTHINKLIGMAFILFALYVNSLSNTLTVNDISMRKGTDISSWRFYEKLSKDIFADAPNEFGYFIYAPDIIAYQAKWAMQYGVLHHPDKKVARYTKKNTTYLIVEPPPKDMPQFTPESWIADKVKLEGKLATSWCYPNNYCVEKWSLTDAQVAVAPDPNIDDWLHYR
jgi:hypothetical protein